MDERTWFLVDDGKAMPRWCVIEPAVTRVWVDAKARTWPFEAARALAHVTGETIECTLDGVPPEVAALERDLAVERLLDPWSDQGWLSPDGTFYGCAYYAHDDIAHALLRERAATLGHRGFVRVHADSYATSPFSITRLTPAQRRTLEALGFDTENHLKRIPYEADRSGPAPRFAYAPRGRSPAPPTDVPEAPVGAGAVAAFLDRLRADAEIGFLFEREEPEIVLDLGGGNWEWLLHFEGACLDVGTGERLRDLVGAPGLYLHATAGDQVEMVAWHVPGTHVSPDARTALDAAEGRRCGPRP